MNKKLFILLSGGLLLLTSATYLYYQAEVPDQTKLQKEITLCGSTLPTTCYTYSCETGYLVPDEDFQEFRIPGGPNRNKMCDDGSKAIETVQ
ncbi:MAG: hypothetical protein R3B53_01455 [Candidatus Paceibacterota bacterium]